MHRATSIVAALALAGLALSACGSSAPTATSTSTTTTAPPSTTLATGTAQDLVVSPAIRASILDAGAAYHQLPPSDYVGLDPRMTYYALDTATHVYYAAAGLDPSPHSLKAQVGAQDDGGYNLFTRTSLRASWRVYNDGLGGSDGARCPIVIPASVLKVWHWAPGGCYPPLN